MADPNDLAAIHAVFDDPQLEGMDQLYAAIAEELRNGADFGQAYSTVIEASGPTAITWIRFCVQCATRFDEPPIEADFLAVLESFSRRQLGRE